MNKIKISVIIATYERSGLLADCIKGITKQNFNKASYEIIIVENSKNEDMYFKNKKSYESLVNKFIRSQPPGLSHARNVGLNNSTGDLVLYLDDDAIPDINLLKNLWGCYEKTGAKIVGGRILPEFETQPPPWLTEKLIDYVTVIDYGSAIRPLNKGEWLAGACLAFDRLELVRVKGFPENLGRIGSSSLLSNDETPVVDEIRRSGGEAFYCGSAVVRHWVPKERMSKKWFRKRAIWQAISDCIKGELLTENQQLQFKKDYLDWLGTQNGIGNSIFQMYSGDKPEKSIGSFEDEVGFLYQCTRYLIQSGDQI